jgi:hypothetical protein
MRLARGDAMMKSPALRPLLHRLLLASHWGAGLALASACSAQVESGAEPASTSSAGGSAPIDPTPDPTCYGPVLDGGYVGQCCDEVLCTAPVDGACPAAEGAAQHLTGLPPGSGRCMCGEIRGPYANRAATDPASCCYLVGAIGCEGRPLLVDGEPRLAPLLRDGGAWSEALSQRFERALAELDATALSPVERRTLARLWAERGRNEHASVASFSRFALGLMALGAPPELLEASHRAAIDEVRHARLALALASAYEGEPLGVGPLPLHGALGDVGSLEAVTLATVVEGCVGETLSAVQAQVEAESAEPPAVRMALEAIARDEARHAELAWAFVRWALTAGGARLRAQAAAAFEQAIGAVCAAAPGEAHDDPRLAAHGFLRDGDRRALRRQAAAEVLRPAAAALLAARPGEGRARDAGAEQVAARVL